MTVNMYVFKYCVPDFNPKQQLHTVFEITIKSQPQVSILIIDMDSVEPQFSREQSLKITSICIIYKLFNIFQCCFCHFF